MPPPSLTHNGPPPNRNPDRHVPVCAGVSRSVPAFDLPAPLTIHLPPAHLSHPAALSRPTRIALLPGLPQSLPQD